ncbi:MAG TPA: hypothetical protein VJL29_09780 [Thermoguttaceae bacterium]|nr:hypothetical protein [Thermoguttaceae bacterium]
MKLSSSMKRTTMFVFFLFLAAMICVSPALAADPAAAGGKIVGDVKISWPDYFMLIGYFVLMLGIGAYFYRFMRGMKVYFTGGNQIPWWLSGVSFYMSSFSAYGFVIFSGMCFRYGWVGVTIFWVTVPATIFSAMLFASRWRRARIDSPVEFLESRYSALVRQLFVWTGVPVGIVDDSLKLIATGTIVHVGMGFSIETSVVACGIIMVTYTFMGGLWAVTVTDFVQFVILAVAVVVVFPLAIAKAGGFSEMVENSPAGFFQPVTEQYNWVYILLLVGLYSVAYSSTHWHLIQKYFCVATERDARKVGWLVVVLNIIGPPLILVPAIASRQFLPESIIDKEVYPRLCAALLPVGMLGLIIAAMFSATMANLSSHFNVRASVLTNDVYRRLVRPHATEKELVVAGRAMTALVGGLTIILAYSMAQFGAPKLFDIMVTLFGAAVAPLGIPMLVGLVSRRVNNFSATAGVVGGLAVSIILVTWMDPKGFEWLGLHWERATVIFAVSTATVLLLMYGFSAIQPTLAALVGGLVVSIVFFLVLPERFEWLGIQWQRGILAYIHGGLAVLALRYSFSAIRPMGVQEAQRVALFHKRLDAPIGELPEDRVGGEAEGQPEGAISPFRIVGICVACIGVMMLCIQPFIHERLPQVLNVILGLVLVAIGWTMTWLSKRASRRDAA